MNIEEQVTAQIIKISLDGIKIVLKFAGSVSKNFVSMIYNVLTQKNKTKGEVRLNNLLRSGKVLKILTLKNDDVKKFTQEAKKYGVTYCMLRDKSLNDGITDIIVKAEDAPKINRIVERFKLVSTQSENPKQSSENPIINPTNPENPTLVQTEKSSQLEDTLKTQEKPSVREQLQKINNVKKACVLDKKHEKTR